jgi:transcriptional regulator with XRE-family HTH domain
MAHALGTDVGTISRWERGTSRPRTSGLRRLRELGLLRAPTLSVRFVDDPAARIRLLDDVLADQLALKRRARPVG